MPRNKHSEGKSPTIDPSELPELTAKQLGFVRGILEGKTASDAYRAAYDTQNMADDTIWAEASRLRHDRKVSAWITGARQANMDRATLTLDGHMSELARLRDIAIATGNVGAAVLAETNRGKASGLYTDRVEDVTKRENDLNGIIARIAQMDPIAAAALRHSLGLDAESEPTAH